MAVPATGQRRGISETAEAFRPQTGHGILRNPLVIQDIDIPDLRGIAFALRLWGWTTVLPESRHRVMPLPPSLPNPPQTAADLLAGLLRSQLLAESLFGQVWEQSSPYFERRADEYAAALVEKRVITQWQATELLEGRTGFYAGTFRLLERLATTAAGAVFAAEQTGPQRLVLVQIARVETADGSVAFRSTKGQSFAERKTTPPSPARHPNIVRCLEVQQTPQLHLVAYDFIEAKTLSELLAVQPTVRTHVADLVRQLAAAVVVLNEQALADLSPEAAWIDGQGQLKLLAGPDPWASISELSRSSSGRVDLQMATVRRFATAWGGVSEIAECQSINEMLQRLAGIAELWGEPFARDTLRCPRPQMSRLLRRGPALRMVESFGADQQVRWEGASPAAEAVAQWSDSGPAESTFVKEERGGATDVPSTVIPSVNRRGRAWAFSGLLWLLGAGVVATQWFKQSGVRRAKATTEPAALSEIAVPVTPAPSQTGHSPDPQ